MKFILLDSTDCGRLQLHPSILSFKVPVSLNRDRASGPGGLSLNDGFSIQSPSVRAIRGWFLSGLDLCTGRSPVSAGNTRVLSVDILISIGGSRIYEALGNRSSHRIFTGGCSRCADLPRQH